MQFSYGMEMYYLDLFYMTTVPVYSYFICDFGTVKQLSLGVGDSVLNCCHRPFELLPNAIGRWQQFKTLSRHRGTTV